MIILLSLFPGKLFSQDSLSIDTYIERRDNISLGGMKVLKYWGGANLGIGTVGAFTTDGSLQYFNQMNALWGGINLLIGVIATKTYKNQPQRFELENLYLQQKKIEQNFLMNTAFDVVYAGAGFGMLNYSTREGVQKERLEGYAYSVIMQAAFLFVFDAGMYYLHKRNGNKHLKKLKTPDDWD